MNKRSSSTPLARKGTSNSRRIVREIYHKLSRSWGPQHWWPAETPFEVIVGAILTQNTSWTNVERAIANLRAAGKLSIDEVRTAELGELELLVRPSGYFRQKAKRLKEFIAFVDSRYGGSLTAMLAQPTLQLREELVKLKGIGPETADSILLYAGHHPIFVVDAYTRRVLERHDAVGPESTYDEIRNVAEEALSEAGAHLMVSSVVLDSARPAVHEPSAMSAAAKSELAQKYNEMHGLFVQIGKHYCLKRNPKCFLCPLGMMLEGNDLRKSRA